MSEVDKQKLHGKKTIGEILETATAFEEIAEAFYSGMAAKVSKHIRYLVEELAAEETEHVRLFKSLAENPDVEKVLELRIARPVSDTRFSDAVMTPDLGEHPDDQTIVQFAIEREDMAMKQYAELAETTPEGPLRTAFRALANEETKHKLELEKIYDQLVHSGEA